jgi:PAS domain S-box-containing protein
MLTRAPNLETATLWNKALAFWPLIITVALHFTLVFTENSILKRKLTLFILYLPAIYFAIINLTTNAISVTPILKSWGYAITYPQYSLLCTLDGIWAAATTMITLILYAYYYFHVKDGTKKQQTKYVAIGFALPIVTSIITDSMFPVVGIDFPILGNITVGFTAFIIAYAIVKIDLFGLNVEIAAENVFSTMPDSVFLVNLTGVIVQVNTAFIEQTGYQEKDIVGKSVNQITLNAEVLNKEGNPPKLIAQLRKQKLVKNYEISFLNKQGEKRFGALSGSIVKNNQGREVGIAFVLHDLTEHKELSKKLLDTQRLASIGELAGIIGHDLRNPLTGIKGAAYYLKTKYSPMLDSKDATMFETIDKSIDYSNKIVNDLIDYSTDIHLELENTTPQKIVQTAVGYIPPPQNIQVINQAKETVLFKVDAPKICRGFMNLIKNAYDAMPNGGTLTITTKIVDEKIVFTFTDTGEGMTPDTLRKIWSPLFTTKAKGMGFGLAICKRSVEAHGGKISAESKHKKGTIIMVELPLNLDNHEHLFEKLLEET